MIVRPTAIFSSWLVLVSPRFLAHSKLLSVRAVSHDHGSCGLFGPIHAHAQLDGWFIGFTPLDALHRLVPPN